ncbi:glutathione synthetase atp-binding domain [Fusarium sporotrichioides]|uniref:Glutathione synthetase atp-binding domain n=1 Tax=Fusarium sporotrichioides TaxID=5514 RepID=A0A395RSV3_FUSSP|nr:glutathione synthetase atp-binding domain [Fusarium sporotrichioides]
MSSSRVAVLYQAMDPPIINGVRKPKKPGGYQDSGADIAYNLSQCKDIGVVTPTDSPNPLNDGDWCFPDTEKGILDAIDKGANCLWSNTIVFASHPLQTSTQLTPFQDRVRVVGQGPLVVDKYDDKKFVNDYLRAVGGFTMPQTNTASSLNEVAKSAGEISYPVVAKPIRGRGSFGVKVCHNRSELVAHVKELSNNSMAFVVEEFLRGEEATVTVMPPARKGEGYWSLPIVTRFNHQDGIAPYNGVVAVTANSRVLPKNETGPLHEGVARECEQAASLLRLTAPIRIDVRRFQDTSESPFGLFDVNMKPVSQLCLPDGFSSIDSSAEYDRPRQARPSGPS